MQSFDFPLDDARHVQTDDGHFHAVYNINGEHVDIWSFVPHACPATGLPAVEHLGRLVRDTYHTQHFLVHFVSIDGVRWRLVFNSRFEGLSVYELPSLREVYRARKIIEFLGMTTPLPVAEGLTAPQQALARRFVWAWSWAWHPEPRPCIYDMYALATTGNPVCTVACDDVQQRHILRGYLAWGGPDHYHYDRVAGSVCPPVEFVRYDEASATLYVRLAAVLRSRSDSASSDDGEANDDDVVVDRPTLCDDDDDEDAANTGEDECSTDPSQSTGN